MHEYGVLASTDPEGESWDLYEENLRPGEVFDWATGNAAYAGQVVAGEDGRFYFYAPVESVDQTLPNRMAIGVAVADTPVGRSEEHTSELQSRGHLVCRLLLEKKKHSNTIGKRQEAKQFEV